MSVINDGLFLSARIANVAQAFAAVALLDLKRNGPDAGSRFYETMQKRLEALGPKGTERHRQNEDALTEHAVLLRSMNAHMISLAGNLEALRVSQDCSAMFEEWAAHSMGWLKANVEAMESAY